SGSTRVRAVGADGDDRLPLCVEGQLPAVCRDRERARVRLHSQGDQMTTNIQLIGDALRLINVINEVKTPSAEQGATALRVLNQLMEEWEECGIKVQYYEQTSTSVNFPCPAWTESA